MTSRSSSTGSASTAPVHGLLTGSREETDRRIVIEQSPRFGIVGKEQTISFRVERRPPAATARSRVTVRVGNGRADHRDGRAGPDRSNCR